MALYKIWSPAFVDGTLIRVDHTIGREIGVSDDLVPSIEWEPLDETAKVAMAKYEAERKARGTAAEFILNQAKIYAQAMQQIEAGVPLPASDVPTTDAAAKKK